MALAAAFVAFAGCGGDRSLFLGIPGDTTHRTMIVSVRSPATTNIELVDLDVDVEPLRLQGEADALGVEALLYEAPWSDLAVRYVLEPGELTDDPAGDVTLPEPDAIFETDLGDPHEWRTRVERSPRLAEFRVASRSDCETFTSPIGGGNVGRFADAKRYTFAVPYGTDDAIVGWNGGLARVTVGGVAPIDTSTSVRLRAGAASDDGTIFVIDDQGTIYELDVPGAVLTPFVALPVPATIVKMIARRGANGVEIAALNKATGELFGVDAAGVRMLHRFSPAIPGDDIEAVVLRFLDDPKRLTGIGMGGPGFIAGVPADPMMAVVVDGIVETLDTRTNGVTASTVVDGSLVLASVNGEFSYREGGAWVPWFGLGGNYALSLYPRSPGFVFGGLIGRLQHWVPNGGFCPPVMTGFSNEHLIVRASGLLTVGEVPNDEGRLEYAYFDFIAP